MEQSITVAAMFITATRQAYRFPSASGELTIEQLWTLPLTSSRAHQACLDDIARSIHKELTDIGETSFVNTKPNPKKPELEIKLEVVKLIIQTKQEENAAKAAKIAAANEAAKLEAILETKEASELQNLSADEIRKRLAEAKAKASS